MTTESKAREFKEIKIPEIWVGFTKDNFARWMAAKDPNMDKCPFYFISEGGDKCVDVKVFVAREKVDQLQAELKAKDELLRECEKALEHYANKRISEGGTARAYFEKWKKDAKT